MLSALSGAGCTSRRELGNVLRVAVRDKYKSLDPIEGSSYYTNILICRTYEGLLRFHYLKRPYEVEPALAEGLPTVSKDGLTYTFKIKKGVLFQDDKAFAPSGKGRELTAEDFVYSFKRLADPHLQAEGWWVFDGKISGLNEWRERQKALARADYGAPVEGLRAVDSRTLVLGLTKPNPVLSYILAMPYTSVVAREAVEHYGKDFVLHPVGTGPFRLASLTGSQAVWERNPTFHGQAYPTEGAPGDKEAGLLADAGKPLPFVDRIVDDIIAEDQPAWLGFMQGAHDYLMKVPKDNQLAVFDSQHKPVKELRDKGIGVHTTPGVWFNYVAFNMEDPVVGGPKNRYLRQAMSLAYDEAPAIEKFYLGLATKAESPIPPGIAGYDPGYRNPWREYNLVKARQILARAGHPNGEGIPELVYGSRSDTNSRQISEYFQRQMARLGVRIRVDVMSWPELLSRIRKKQGQVWGISWLYDYPDAENGWQLLYGKNESPGSNESNYKNPGFDALYEKMAALRDGPGRRALIARMREIFEQDLPWIIQYNQMETRLTNAWAHNLKIHGFEHNVEKYMRIDAAGRAKALK